MPAEIIDSGAAIVYVSSIETRLIVDFPFLMYLDLSAMQWI